MERINIISPKSYRLELTDSEVIQMNLSQNLLNKYF